MFVSYEQSYVSQFDACVYALLGTVTDWRGSVYTEFCVVSVGGCCMLSVCVEVDVCYGPHMGAGGRAALCDCVRRWWIQLVCALSI